MDFCGLAKYVEANNKKVFFESAMIYCDVETESTELAIVYCIKEINRSGFTFEAEDVEPDIVPMTSNILNLSDDCASWET